MSGDSIPACQQLPLHLERISKSCRPGVPRWQSRGGQPRPRSRLPAPGHASSTTRTHPLPRHSRSDRTSPRLISAVTVISAVLSTCPEYRHASSNNRCSNARLSTRVSSSTSCAMDFPAALKCRQSHPSTRHWSTHGFKEQCHAAFVCLRSVRRGVPGAVPPRAAADPPDGCRGARHQARCEGDGFRIYGRSRDARCEERGHPRPDRRQPRRDPGRDQARVGAEGRRARAAQRALLRLGRPQLHAGLRD